MKGAAAAGAASLFNVDEEEDEERRKMYRAQMHGRRQSLATRVQWEEGPELSSPRMCPVGSPAPRTSSEAKNLLDLAASAVKSKAVGKDIHSSKAVSLAHGRRGAVLPGNTFVQTGACSLSRSRLNTNDLCHNRAPHAGSGNWVVLTHGHRRCRTRLILAAKTRESVLQDVHQQENNLSRIVELAMIETRRIKSLTGMVVMPWAPCIFLKTPRRHQRIARARVLFAAPQTASVNCSEPPPLIHMMTAGAAKLCVSAALGLRRHILPHVRAVRPGHPSAPGFGVDYR